MSWFYCCNTGSKFSFWIFLWFLVFFFNILIFYHLSHIRNVYFNLSLKTPVSVTSMSLLFLLFLLVFNYIFLPPYEHLLFVCTKKLYLKNCGNTVRSKMMLFSFSVSGGLSALVRGYCEKLNFSPWEDQLFFTSVVLFGPRYKTMRHYVD